MLELELRLLAESGDLRFFHPATGSLLRSHAEAEAYAAARRAAEEEAARLRAELERLTGKTQGKM